MPSQESAPKINDKLNKYYKEGREVIAVNLVRKTTLDGLLEMLDNVPLGTKYVVYAETQWMRGVHNKTGTHWEREMYECVDDGWLPTELLERL